MVRKEWEMEEEEEAARERRRYSQVHVPEFFQLFATTCRHSAQSL